MSDHYPASEDIDAEYAEVDDLFENEALQQDAINKGYLKPAIGGTQPFQASTFNPSIGRDKYTPSKEPFNLFSTKPNEQDI